MTNDGNSNNLDVEVIKMKQKANKLKDEIEFLVESRKKIVKDKEYYEKIYLDKISQTMTLVAGGVAIPAGLALIAFNTAGLLAAGVIAFVGAGVSIVSSVNLNKVNEKIREYKKENIGYSLEEEYKKIKEISEKIKEKEIEKKQLETSINEKNLKKEENKKQAYEINSEKNNFNQERNKNVYTNKKKTRNKKIKSNDQFTKNKKEEKENLEI